MSAIGNIAINDGKATPELHTYIPIQSGPESVYRTADAALPLVGQESVVIRTKSQKGQNLNRVQVILELPALEEASGQNASGYTAAPKVAYMNKVSVEFILPSRGTAAQRKDLRVLLSNALLNAQVVDAVENLNMPY